MRLCYYCGASGHLIHRCPERPSSAQVALIDSGAAVNLIDGALVKELGIPTTPCVPSLRITAIDSQPIGGGYLTLSRWACFIKNVWQASLVEDLASLASGRIPRIQSLINGVFQDILGKWVIAYIDEILVYSTSLEEHTTMTFLGYVITRQGVEMDATKGKPRRLAWTDQAQAAFQQLKDGFTTAPILRHPDPDLPFVVEVDTSSSSIGAMLSQRHGEPGKLHPYAFYSRKLTAVEANYDVSNRELLSIKAALEEWRHWLEGAHHPFQVLTDHRNLQYLRGTKQLNPRQARWAVFFTCFQFSVTYRPGSKNCKADALSRQFEASSKPVQPDLILSATTILAPVRWSLMEAIRRAHADEPPPAGCPATKVFVPLQFRRQKTGPHTVEATPTPAPPAITSANTATTPSPLLYTSPMAKPAPYSGSAEDCNGFLLQCSLVLEMQPHMFPTEQSKVVFLITQLSGKALLWADSIWSQNHPAIQSYSSFIDHFKEVFGKPSWDSSIGEELYNLKQGKMSVNEYAFQFRTLAAKSRWNEQALLTSYCQGLDPQVRLHLTAYEDSIRLERLIQLSIRFATCMQSCLEELQGQAQLTTILCQPGSVSPPKPAHEPMQLESSRLTPAERQRRLTQNLCLYCGAPGHVISACPIRPPRPMVSAIFPSTQKMKPLTTIGKLTAADVSIPVAALLDSGSAGNFISGALCHQLKLKTTATSTTFFFVAKKDGGLRSCIDYRALNYITVKFRYPLPLVPVALEHFRGATVFTKLDLRSVYNLIRIREGDEWKTAFVMPTGHYKYLVMPYGLVNAPSVFQDFIQEVLREFLHMFVLAYIADILIYSRSLAEHRHHIAEVLKRLRKFQLFLKAVKCSFHQPSVQFLGAPHLFTLPIHHLAQWGQ
ncbi:hypothetical protein QTP70_005696 [Hemibagrus guttatus]|uniref:ribonuclease H n=1 Tax=Hemibagrus guttatus TaxID=175788 RepID=A0AAE0Q9S0_9TELE|nr:hypothetical protein QTP70_005696 [Hemibagrus guttatus]